MGNNEVVRLQGATVSIRWIIRPIVQYYMTASVTSLNCGGNSLTVYVAGLSVCPARPGVIITPYVENCKSIAKKVYGMQNV